MRRATEIVRFPASPGDPHQPVSTPIYQTATFAQDDPSEPGRYDYSRSGNPTRTVLEEQLARLDGGIRGFAYTSGMAALSAVLRLVGPGERIVAGDDLYGGTWRLLSRVVAPLGIEVRYVDLSDVDRAREAIAGARLVLVETPTNPLQRIVDLAATAEICRSAGAWFAVDGSAATPYLQRPLAHGAALVVHSATKGLSGHADLTAGAVVTSDPALAERLAFDQNAEGTGLAPFDAWLLLRGTKTLAIRYDRAQASASRIARWLVEQPWVAGTFFPGLPDHPGRRIHERQASGPGVVLSFTTGDARRSVAIARHLRLFTRSVSFGSVNSVVALPCLSSHASIPGSDRRLPEDLVRLSIGIEDVDDLLEDLARAGAT